MADAGRRVELCRRAPSFDALRAGDRHQLQARVSEIADEVDRTHQRVLVKNGRAYVVLVPIALILSDEPVSSGVGGGG
ncbi:MAG: hypothetical protein ACM3ZF_06815 [Mycobacterium leprae]